MKKRKVPKIEKKKDITNKKRKVILLGWTVGENIWERKA